MRFYEESHSGWKARPNLTGGYEILDGNGWAVAVLNYDYRYTCNATNHYRAKMLATAPDLLEYVKSSASAGCATARAIIARMDAAETEPAPTAGQEPPLTQAQLDEQAKLWDGGSELIRGGPDAGRE